MISPEDFVLETRNDFTVLEFEDALNSGEEIAVHTSYKPNKNAGRQNDGTYVPYFSDEVVGYELYEVEDPYYEGVTLQGFGTFEVINTGNLGDGHEAWSVLRHNESGRLFRRSGYYSSWDGGDWDGDLVEVEPVQVTVTRFKPLDEDKPFSCPVLNNYESNS